MKPTLSVLVLFVLFSFHSSAQTFNYESVKLKYKLPAKTPFVTEFKTITVRFHGEENLKRYGILPSELLTSDFKFSRFKNIPKEGDLHLDVFVGTPEYLGVQRDKETRKENEVEVTYHFYRGTVITPISFELRDGGRNLIEEKIVYDATDHLHFTTERHKSISVLASTWEESKDVVVSKMIATILKQSLTNTSKDIKDRFDDQILDEDINIFDIKKPEKIKAEFLNTAFTKITSGLSQNPVITDWDDAKKTEIKDLLIKATKFSAEDKDERIAYAIGHYNLALLYALWGNLETAKSHIQKGRVADRKNYEFDQLATFVATLDNRGVADELAAKQYVATFQPGSDSKLPGVSAAVKTNAVGEDFSAKPNRTIDTVYVKNGDKIVGYVKAVHNFRKLGEDQIHDFSHLVINPTNMPQEEIIVKWDDIIYMRHKEGYMIPLVTKIALSTNPPIHLYEPVKVSTDQKLGFMRTAYHESMPYHLNDVDNRAYLFTYTKSKDETEIFPITGGAKYALNFNGGLASDFEFCAAIVNKTKNKHYKLTEDFMKELVDDYNGCRD